MTQRHIPVLQQEVLEVLKPTESDIYVDLTAGFGGYAATSSWEATHVVATHDEKKWGDEDEG